MSHFPALPLSTNFCEGLNGLSFRCIQPGQQQGRRIPSLSSETTLLTCSFLVSGFLTEMVQQIHSLRASGVISSHADRALGSDDKAFRRSVGSPCATPPEIFLLISSLYAYREALGSSAAVQHRKFASLNVRFGLLASFRALRPMSAIAPIATLTLSDHPASRYVPISNIRSAASKQHDHPMT